MREVPDACAVRWLALDPEGAPLAGARIAWETDGSGAGEVASDGTGRFLVAFAAQGDGCETPGGRVALRAADPMQRFAPSPTVEVFAGGPPVTLQLARGRFLELLVSADGEPLEAFEWSFVSEADGRQLARGGGHFRGGVVRELAPAVPFRAEVELHGFEVARSALIEPESAPDVLPLALVRRHGVSGRVSAAGAPIAGASVRLLLPLADTVAVADGRFDAVPPGPRAYLRVRAPGFATALVGPLETDMQGSFAGLEVELTRGGALEGRVIAPPEIDPEALVVGACCGDGIVLTTRPDARGEYRFEHLAPGPWQIGLCESDRNPDLSVPSYRLTKRPDELPQQVEIEEGATARFDLARERACRVVGRLTVGGAAPRPFRGRAAPARVRARLPGPRDRPRRRLRVGVTGTRVRGRLPAASRIQEYRMPRT